MRRFFIDPTAFEGYFLAIWRFLELGIKAKPFYAGFARSLQAGAGPLFLGMRRILLPCILFLFACRSKSDQQEPALRQFREVEESLRKNAQEARERERPYEPEPMSVFLEARLLLNRLKLLVQQADSTGERLDIGDSLIIDTPSGAELYTAMRAVYQRSSNETFRSELRYNREEWLRRYFYRLPSVALVTILHKIGQDVEAIAGEGKGSR